LSLIESDIGTTISFGAIALTILQGLTASCFDSSDVSLIHRYPENWKEIAFMVKEQVGWQCCWCGQLSLFD
jgi:hypothetical protein